MLSLKKITSQAISSLFYLLCGLSPAWAADNFIEKVYLADKNGLMTPHISIFDKNATLEKAYKTQIAFVDKKAIDTPIAGYKAGLTSKPGQKKFGVDQPLSAVLFADGLVSDLKRISLSGAGKLMLETELGFILLAKINQPLHNAEDLKKYIAYVAAVIELPDLGYENLKVLKGVDLVAGNVASHQYIIGPKLPLSRIGEVNTIKTKMVWRGDKNESQNLISGKATDALGNQWEALFWLVNQLIAQGYTLEAGNLLITGALGKMVPAKVGRYSAEFDNLGQIQFEIID